MIITNPTISEYVVKPIQQDYITAAETHRLAKSISQQSPWSDRISGFWQAFSAALHAKISHPPMPNDHDALWQNGSHST